MYDLRTGYLSAYKRRCSISHLISIFSILFYLVLVAPTSAFSDEPIDISADQLEYIAHTDTYIAKGSAVVTSGDAVLRAREILLDNSTYEARAEGNVVYEDNETIIHADRIEINLKTKMGVLYNSYIFYKKENYHLRGGDLRKIGEKSYLLDKASVTTCNAPSPEWHVTGKSIKTELHRKIEARDAALYVKNVPILYTPYFWMPLTRERQSGFLVPSAGSSSTKGFIYKQGFFWAIREDRDATLYLDYFSKKGFGKGVEYRYILTPENSGMMWGYHLQDRDLKRDFFEIKSYQKHRLPYNITGFLKLHTVNDFDYYDILGDTSDRASSFSNLGSIPISSWRTAFLDFDASDRLQKYLESNLHFSKPVFSGSRVYILDQYRQSLEEDKNVVPRQNSLNLGFVLNAGSRGSVMYDASFTGSDFRADGTDEAQRFILTSNIYVTRGREVNLTQKIGVRETVYILNNPDDFRSRLLLETSTSLTTRLLKRYASFIHLVEPSLEYLFVPEVEDDNIPLFDAIESVQHVSLIRYSFTNRIEPRATQGAHMRFRLSQSYSLLDDDRPFSPFLAEGSLSAAFFDIALNASYDSNESRITDSIASLTLKNSIGYITLGKNYRLSTDLDQYTVSAGTTSPVKLKGKSIPLLLDGKLWYDLNGAGVQESRLRATYRSQCWGVAVMYSRKPDEEQIAFQVDLIGLGSLKW